MKINKFEWCNAIEDENVRKQCAKLCNKSPSHSLVIENDIYSNWLHFEYLIGSDNFFLEALTVPNDINTPRLSQRAIITMTKAQTLEFVEKIKECLDYKHQI